MSILVAYASGYLAEEDLRPPWILPIQFLPLFVTFWFGASTSILVLRFTCLTHDQQHPTKLSICTLNYCWMVAIARSWADEAMLSGQQQRTIRHFCVVNIPTIHEMNLSLNKISACYINDGREDSLQSIRRFKSSKSFQLLLLYVLFERRLAYFLQSIRPLLRHNNNYYHFLYL